MVTVSHAKLSHAPADPTALIDGPAWDAAHVVTNLQASDVNGLAASATTDTTQANNITGGTLNAARLPVLAGSSNPLINGTASPGASSLLSRQDHVHPTDTTRAPLASPVFTGTPAGPTPTAGDNTTKLATTAFVAASFAPLASPAFTGTPTGPTPSNADNSTKLATTAWVASNSSFVVSGTTMLFLQSSAPTGWTRVTTYDDALLRIVGSAAPSSGGSNGFVAAFNSQTATSGFTITTNQLPTMSTYPTQSFASFNPIGVSDGVAPPAGGGTWAMYSNYPQINGSGSAHTHGITTNINYVDALVARKN